MRHRFGVLIGDFDKLMYNVQDALQRMPFAKRRMKRAQRRVADSVAHLTQLMDAARPYVGKID
jgi:hypothetical protein